MSDTAKGDPLFEIRAKLGRANEHLKALNKALDDFYQSDFYARGMKQDRKGGVVLYVKSVKPVPPIVSILAGETVHQLRSVLDHLMWLLAKPTRKQESDVAFPLVSTRLRFRGTRQKMPGVPRGVRTVVESLQPYHSRKWPDTALLGVIQAISNRDKHRTLATTAVSLESLNPNVRVVAGATIGGQQTFRGVLKVGAKLHRFNMSYIGPDAEMYVKPELTLISSFRPWYREANRRQASSEHAQRSRKLHHARGAPPL